MSEKFENLTDAEINEEVKKQILLDKVSAILNKLDAITDGVLTDEFLALKVYQSPALNEVIQLVFDKAVSSHELCEIYARLCSKQVLDEIRAKQSKFCNELLQRAQDTFTTKNMNEIVREKKAEIDAETNEAEREEMQIELLRTQNRFRKTKFGNIRFIGHLYLQKLISVRIIVFCIVDLLESVTTRKLLDGFQPDEESVECAVALLETIGKRLHDENAHTDGDHSEDSKQNAEAAFPLDGTFETLQAAIPFVSNRLGEKIQQLVELRALGWKGVKHVDVPSVSDVDEASVRLRKLEFDNSQLQGAVCDMQIAMDQMRAAVAHLFQGAVCDMQIAADQMRAAMAHLEQKNRDVLNLIRRQGDREAQ